VGDAVRVGDLLAELDMSRLETDLSQAEINLRSAVASAEEEIRANENSIVNARTSLESSQISLARQQLNTTNVENDLREAEERISEEFDSYNFDIAIEDARLDLSRRTEDIEKAQKDLRDAANNFDDYIFQNSITDARINLDRRRVELSDAENSRVSTEVNSSITIGGYQNALMAAEANLAARETALSTAKAARDAIDEATDKDAYTIAQTAVNLAQIDRDRANAAVVSASSDLNRAWDRMIEPPPQRSIDNARDAVGDAQRRLDRAITDLERAKDNAVEAATDALTRVQNAHDDAQRRYERALNEKIRAIDNFEESNETRLENAQRSHSDSLRQLDASRNSVRSAQNSFNQAQSRPASQSINVELSELNVERLQNQLVEGKIIATADGVITEINARVGSAPSGILFVIEDTKNLQVSARVREHNIAAVQLGQETIITTDATGDRAYEGEVSFISPRAVSAAGSTSVEFEVQAELKNTDSAIMIGMNAFLEIITEQRPDVYAVPNSVIVTNERGSFVYAMEEEERQEIAVELGLRTMVNVEISGDGLYDGIYLIVDPEGLISGANSPIPPMWGRW
jgi:multidrug efflux pump subunit AcrA (membrane-fusion protein)